MRGSDAEPAAPPPRDATARVRALVCLALLATAATRFASRTFGEPEFDVWWMLVVGRIAGLQATFADPLSFTAPGVLHHNHTYLHCALLATVERLGGLAGVWGLKVALAGGLTAGVVAFLWRRVHDPLALLALGTLGYGIFVVPWLLMRPQLWTYLALFGLLVLMQSQRDRRGWPLLLAVPLLAVWQGLHGAAALGVVFLAVETIGSSVGWLERRPSVAHALPRWTALGGVAIVLCLAPYSVLGTVGEKLGSLGAFPTTEWLPVWDLAAFQVAFPGAAGVLVAAAMAGAIVASAGVLGAAHRIRGGYHREAVFLVVAFVLALRMIRNLPVLGLTLVVLLAEPVDVVAGAWWRRARRAPAYGRLSAASLACGTFVLACVAVTHALGPTGPDPARFPVAACAWLAHEQPEGGNLLTDDPSGSYATWCLPRTWKVSIDGREELLYPAPVLIDHRTLAGPSTQAAADVVARWRPDAILLPASAPLARATGAPPGYTVRYRDPSFVVWTKDAVGGDGRPAAATT